MKKLSFIFVSAVATLICCSVGHASITNAWWNDDGDGALVCSGWSYSGNSLYMQGIEYSATTPGHMLGWVQTTDPTDPTLTLGSAVNNDSGQAWISYQVNVIMSTPFTFVAPGPTVNNPLNDWSVASVIAPTLQVGGNYNGDYLGTIDYAGGTPVGVGQELDYLYSIHFTGASSYTFTQESIPGVAPVPEPGTIALLAIGGLGFALRLRRNSRKGA
jgi:hypothetical protein